MDRVFIEGLEVDTVIGAYDWERDIRQCLRLDLSFAWDNRPAAAGDDLSLALDYASVSARIQAFSEQARFELVETFAERLVAVLMEEFNIPWVRLKLTKPGAVPAARGGVGGVALLLDAHGQEPLRRGVVLRFGVGCPLGLASLALAAPTPTQLSAFSNRI